MVKNKSIKTDELSIKESTNEDVGISKDMYHDVKKSKVKKALKIMCCLLIFGIVTYIAYLISLKILIGKL
jgi:hypothetical protein